VHELVVFRFLWRFFTRTSRHTAWTATKARAEDAKTNRGMSWARVAGLEIKPPQIRHATKT